MNKFTTYLKECKQSAINESKPLRIALGNTSGDMDSIVGAMGLGYLLTLKTGELWTPVINCEKNDLKLKSEIYGHLIDDCAMDADDLFYWDEMMKVNRPVEEIALIDHNLLDELQAQQLGDDSHSKVTYVYDHHVDNKYYPASQLKDYQVRFIGSACSLLVLLMKENFDLFDASLFSKENKVNFAYLMAAAVMLDTDNFAEHLRDTKWQQEDEFARNWLQQFTTLDREYFNKMQLNKFNQEYALDLGILGNFRRDYKQYKLSKYGVEGVMGIAVVVFDPETMFAHYGHDLVCHEIDQFMQDKGLSTFGLMCNVMNFETHIIERKIFVYSRFNDAFANTYDEFLACNRHSDLLKCTDERHGAFNSSKHCHFSLRNNTVSRKKWEIVFRAFYK